MKVAVVGAGIMGACSAYELASRGLNVEIFDPFAPAHLLGSSHGRSRIFRRAYPDPIYTEMMGEALPIWRALQHRARARLLIECGLLYFGDDASPTLRSVLDGLREQQVEHRLYVGSEVKQTMPKLRLKPSELAIFTPEAGWIDAERALRAIMRLAMAAGAEFNRTRVESLGALRNGYDQVVVCAGAWLPRLLEAEYDQTLPLRVTRQTVAQFDGMHAGPVWIEDSADNVYGFPTSPRSRSFKVGHHGLGPEIDPEQPDREPVQAHLDRMVETVRERFGIEPKIVDALGCLYTNTPDESLHVGRWDDRTVVVSACSGHGFKFGPWIGKVAADLAQGRPLEGVAKRAFAGAEPLKTRSFVGT